MINTWISTLGEPWNMDIRCYYSFVGSRWIIGIAPLLWSCKIGNRWCLKAFNRVIAYRIGDRWVFKLRENYGILIHKGIFIVIMFHNYRREIWSNHHGGVEINLCPLFCCAWFNGLFWFRIFKENGHGIHMKNIDIHPLLFTERNGYYKCLKIKNWSIKLLKSGGKNGRD